MYRDITGYRKCSAKYGNAHIPDLSSGHAQVAVETWEGSGNYLLIETTALPNKNSDFIDEANSILTNWERESDDHPIACLTKEEWAAYLTADQNDAGDDCYVLDCGDGALLGMTPFAN